MSGYFTSASEKPYFVFDDVHSSREASDVLTEFDTILRPMMRRENTGGTDKKNTNACFIGDVYRNFEASPAFNATRKYSDPGFIKYATNHHWLFGALEQHNINMTIQFLYYEKSDNYGSHYDTSLFTFLWWLSHEDVEGGDLILDGTDKIDFRHNRMVMFPIQTKHEVTPVTSKGIGRYCVTNFVILGE